MEMNARRALILASEALKTAVGNNERPEPGSLLEAQFNAYNAVTETLAEMNAHRTPTAPNNADVCGFTWFTKDEFVHCCGADKNVPHTHTCGSTDGCEAAVETTPPGTREAIARLDRVLNDMEKAGGEIAHDLYTASRDVVRTSN